MKMVIEFLGQMRKRLRIRQHLGLRKGSRSPPRRERWSCCADGESQGRARGERSREEGFPAGVSWGDAPPGKIRTKT